MTGDQNILKRPDTDVMHGGRRAAIIDVLFKMNGRVNATHSNSGVAPLEGGVDAPLVLAGAMTICAVALLSAFVVAVHYQRKRKTCETLPFSHHQVFNYTTIPPPCERKLSSVSIKSNESVCIYAAANVKAERPIDFVVPPMLSPGPTLTVDHGDQCLLSPSEIPLGERLSFSGVSGEQAALLASAANLFGGLNPELYKETSESDEYDFPDGHIGRIWFGLDYDAPSERLLVKVVKVRNLPSRTLGQVNCCDPFIRIYLMPDERRYLQTKFKKKTCNPMFDETYVFQIASRHMDERVLKLSVVDNERGKHHNIIGHALYPLKDLDWSCGQNTLVTWKDLEKHVQVETSCDESKSGELHVGLSYNTNLERLTVTVMEARDLSDTIAGDVHMKVCLQQENKVIKSKKTSSHKIVAGQQLKFMESFIFKVKQSHIANVSVIIKAINDSHKDNNPIGRIIVGSFMFARGKALQHWTDAITSAPKLVQEWHKFS